VSIFAIPLFSLAGSLFAFSSLAYWVDFAPVILSVFIHQLYDHAQEYRRLLKESQMWVTAQAMRSPLGAFGQPISMHTRASIRAAYYKPAPRLKPLLVCIFLVGLLLHAATALSADNPDIESLIPKARELYNAGKYQDALPLAEQILAYTENTFGPEDPLTAYSLSNLASLYTAMGDYAKAEPLYQRALQIREKVLGPEHADTATSLNNLGGLYYQLGNYEKAESTLRRVLQIREKILGPKHLDTATSLNDVAMVHRAMGDYAKAESLFQRALAIREKELGSEDAATALSLNNLGLLYADMGEYAKAASLYQRALTIRERVLGAEHPDTALSLSNLAELYRKSGEYAKAEPLCQRALKIREKVLGPQHPDTAASLNNLAGLYVNIGDYLKAEPLFQRALRIHEQVLGPEHPNTATSLNNLGRLYHSMADYAKAEPLYRRALKIQEKILGPEHPDTAASLNNLATLYEDAGDYLKAESLFQRALSINEKLFGSGHPATALSLNNLGRLYTNMGDYAKAERLYQRALQIREALGARQPETASTLNNLGLLYMELGDYAKAEPLYERALRVNEKALGPKHPEVAVTLDNRAGLYRQIGDYSKAKALYERALSIREESLGSEHPQTAYSLNNLAELHQQLGDYAQAEPLLQRALRIREKTLGPEHPDVVSTLNNLAQLYENTGDHGRAESLLNRALEISQKVFGPEHGTTAIVLNNLAGLYHHSGEYSKAEPLYERALHIREKTVGPSHPDTTLSVTNLAWLKLDVPKIADARGLAVKSAASQLKTLSNVLSFCSEPQRLAYQNTIDPYSLFAAIDGSDFQLALACLRNKGVVLDSIIEDRRLAEASKTKEDQELVQRLNAERQRLGQLLLEIPKASTNQAPKQIQQLEQQVEQIEGKLARNVASLGQPRRALAVTVEEVQAAIPADGALIEYLRYPHYLGKAKFEPCYGAIVLTTRGKPRWVPLGKADGIEKGVMRYRSRVVNQETTDTEFEETLRGLFDQVWGPVEKVLPDQTRTVIISPDGQLNFISFATLLSAKDRFLAEDHLIQYVSSGRDLLRDTKLAPNSQLIAFGNPDFNLKAAPSEKVESPAVQQIALRGTTRQDLEELALPALPGTKAECALLAERAQQWKWPCSRFLAADATEAELRKLRSPHILHLATHGFVLDAKKDDHTKVGSDSSFATTMPRYFENPMHRAGLALAGAQATIDAWRRGETPPTENDGIVTAEEVGALNLQGTWLVTLSACNTGVGEAKSGEGVLGLRRGFIQAGAKNLLMTLWPISDETTVEIMAQFYEAAHKTGNAPQALAEVQRDGLVKLRKTDGLVKAVNLAGPFILSSQGKP
jgi:tetratricopeptide (TPR) repeat protein/CHAT domain-containing protein